MEYTPAGDEVSLEACILQATVALDATGILAQDSRDSERMLQVAESWIKLADFMGALEQSRRDSRPEPKLKTGFQPSAEIEEEIREEEIDVRDDEDGADEGPGVDGVHP